tara:strand:+ start:369 stop:713 length:345 start_codon:yes stop_codon:yes gene_type:complete
MLSVHIQPADTLIKVAYLTSGVFFGEMSLLTGSKASATIVTENEAVLYQINKTVMKMLVRKNPEIIKSISMTITNRQADNNKCKETLLSTSEQNAATKPTADKLVSRIYDFFKL